MAGGPANDPGAGTATVYAYSGAPSAYGRRAATVSNVQPVWQFVLLQLCSFGIYDLFWFYQNWSLLKERHRLYITPAARALFRYFFAIHLSREIYKLTSDVGCKPTWSPAGVGVSYILLDFLAGACMRQNAPGIFLMGAGFFVGSVMVRTPLVAALNEFWRREQPGLPERTKLSGKAWIVVVIGVLGWAFALLAPAAEKP